MKNKIIVKKKEEPKKLTRPFERLTDMSVAVARKIQDEYETMDKERPFAEVLSESSAGFGAVSVGIKNMLDSYEPNELPFGITNYWQAIADTMLYTNGRVKESVVRMKSTEYALGVYELVVNAIAQELGEKLFEDLQNNHYCILENLQYKIYNAIAFGYPASCCEHEIFNAVDEYHDVMETDDDIVNEDIRQNMLLPATIGSHRIAAELANAIFEGLYSISCLMIMKCPDFLDEITPYISDILNKSILISYGHMLDIGSTTMFHQAVPFTTKQKQLRRSFDL